MRLLLIEDEASLRAALVPLLEPWLLTFVQLWRTSSLLGQELVSDYVSKYVASGERQRWFK